MKEFTTVFTCLTANVLRSHEFKLAAHDFPLQTAVLANIHQVPHFSFLSIKDAHPYDEWFAECTYKG